MRKIFVTTPTTRSSRPFRRVRSFALAACALFGTLPLRAQQGEGSAESINQCLEHHSATQQLRNQGQLVESRELALQCAAQRCPGDVRKDCLGWVEQLKQQTPSLSLRVTVDGRNETSVKVLLDGQQVLTTLTGRALPLNPGPHEVQIEVEGFPPYQESVFLNEAERFRVVSASFVSEAAPPTAGPGVAPLSSPPTADTAASTPLSVYVLGGVGLAAAINAVGWGVYFRSGYEQLETGCAPNCADDSIDVVKKRGLIADISTGVSVLSLGGAALIYFLAGDEAPASAPVDIAWLPEGGTMATVRLPLD